MTNRPNNENEPDVTGYFQVYEGGGLIESGVGPGQVIE